MQFANHRAGAILAAAFGTSSRTNTLSPEADTALRKKIGFRLRRSIPEMVTPADGAMLGAKLCGDVLAMSPTLTSAERVRSATIAQAIRAAFEEWSRTDPHEASPLLNAHVMRLFSVPMLQCFSTAGVLLILGDG